MAIFTLISWPHPEENSQCTHPGTASALRQSRPRDVGTGQEDAFGFRPHSRDSWRRNSWRRIDRVPFPRSMWATLFIRVSHVEHIYILAKDDILQIYYFTNIVTPANIKRNTKKSFAQVDGHVNPQSHLFTGFIAAILQIVFCDLDLGESCIVIKTKDMYQISGELVDGKGVKFQLVNLIQKKQAGQAKYNRLKRLNQVKLERLQAYLGSSSAAAQVSTSGSLRSGRSSSSTPKICQKGFCPEYGLGGNITLSAAKKVMSEGCDEGYEHWDKMKGCKDSGYVITLEDLADLCDYLLGQIAIARAVPDAACSVPGHVTNPNPAPHSGYEILFLKNLVTYLQKTFAILSDIKIAEEISWSPSPRDLRNLGGVTSALPASCVRIGYLMERKSADGRGGSRVTEERNVHVRTKTLVPRPLHVRPGVSTSTPNSCLLANVRLLQFQETWASPPQA
ncbi:hypothetical protein EVAR_13848_1 [Eumeta japonica]|uniref:Uncharacterized protein n=1 Tax=Eumeta variegata TaxID=151549 RepID=A0A4C1U2L8_EUMVA|nr:hypothetical protein EVAR_13848_1 [Eumeta japonica]